MTSSAMSPGWNAPIALAMVRTSHARAGAALVVKQHERPLPEDGRGHRARFAHAPAARPDAAVTLPTARPG